jgi:hypothetical protein
MKAIQYAKTFSAFLGTCYLGIYVVLWITSVFYKLQIPKAPLLVHIFSSSNRSDATQIPVLK